MPDEGVPRHPVGGVYTIGVYVDGGLVETWGVRPTDDLDAVAAAKAARHADATVCVWPGVRVPPETLAEAQPVVAA